MIIFVDISEFQILVTYATTYTPEEKRYGKGT